MSIFTNFLKLFKTDMATDGDDYFDFDRDLNQNWDKIDEFANYEALNGVYFEKMKDVSIEIPSDETVTEEIEVDYYEVGDVG